MKRPLVNTVIQHRSSEREAKYLIIFAAIVILAILMVKVFAYLVVHSHPEGTSFLSKKLSMADPRKGMQSLDRNTRDKATEAKYIWQALPDSPPEPINNPSTPEKIALGKMLFQDRNLSLDRSIACVDCHTLYRKAGTDHRAKSLGINQQQGQRNAPSVWNAAFQRKLFWDGRADSLEEQAIQPLINPIEMGMPSLEEVVSRVKEDRDYRVQFKRAFPNRSELSITEIAQAIASYERTLVTNDTPYDEYVRGDKTALSSQQLRGMDLFNRTGCTHCHSGPNFSAASVYSSGLAMRVFPANPSMQNKSYAFASQQQPQSAWRVPSLRNVALTGPWLHNGEVSSLKDAVRIMASAQLAKQPSSAFQWTGGQLHPLSNPALTEPEVDDIVAFLQALSSKRLLTVSKPKPNNEAADNQL